MRTAEKVIITTAITGSVHIPSQSPYLPLSADEVADAALEAIEAGSAVVHLHAREPDGRPPPDPEVFEKIVGRITAQTDAVVNITTGGASSMTTEQRLAAAYRLKPELASLNCGRSARPGPGSNTSATTSGTCTRWRTSPTSGRRDRRC